MLGTLDKMAVALDENHLAQYTLRVAEQRLALNPLIGKSLTLSHTGNIFCCNCGKKTKKSYSQGHCYVCMQKLASCDLCVMKPETCHYDQGTCREPEWGDTHCMVPHYVYLSNTSGIKVGITRHTQLPTRWLDQGATQGLPIFKVSSRQLSGLIEVELAKLIADKTNWQAMLKGNNNEIDLKAKAETLLPSIETRLHELAMSRGDYRIERLTETETQIHYPVSEFPKKIKSHNFDKEAVVSGTLMGIKGQYLLFDTGVINIRKFTSYEVEVSY
ncbi:DUF2797 domain-containing protein [Shewanella algae]|uniref:DUF2797 domain-containing protein n=1 Tax=Shewanella algae TaxID=38313 RepID=UPI0005EC09AC|nr:DUF2797 domain-containing protein [Shewanella algae]MBO2603009.1 DUF2797 domain-containing protein [Shewanella algae]TVL53617.1 hypothetical protein AYI98_00230 [Shewanella algae]BCV32001.1 hypothetical protein TUM4442_15280 [Shewanella algae]